MDFESFMKSSVSESKKKFENKNRSLPKWLDDESEEGSSQVESLEANRGTEPSQENNFSLMPKLEKGITESELPKNFKGKSNDTVKTLPVQKENETDADNNKRKRDDIGNDSTKEKGGDNQNSLKKGRVSKEGKNKELDKVNVSNSDLTIQITEIATDPQKVALQIRQYIKNILAEWTDELNKREIKNGKLDCEKDYSVEQEKELLLDTKKSLIPLLVLLKKQNKEFLEKTNMFPALSTVIHYLQIQNFLKANEAYASLSIGNVAWPIGVIGVGIHARSAQSKITGTASMANVMLDEVTRKWITCIKRLITYCEKQQSS